MGRRERAHAITRVVQRGVDPVVRSVQPDLVIASLAPARRSWKARRYGRRVREDVPGRGERDGVLVVRELADEEIEPLRALEPPVAEQLGVVRRDEARHPARIAASEAPRAVRDEVARVRTRLRPSPEWIVRHLLETVA